MLELSDFFPDKEELAIATMIWNTAPAQDQSTEFPYIEQTVDFFVARVLRSKCPLPAGFSRDYGLERDRMVRYISERRIMERLVESGLVNTEGVRTGNPCTTLYRRTVEPSERNVEPAQA